MPRHVTPDHELPDVRSSWHWNVFALCALTAGVLLRLTWGQDIEFKHDEAFMFETALNAGIRAPFPWIGMPSGVGVPNPPLSLWLFIGIARLLPIASPTGLARVVQVSNCIALALVMFMSFRMAARSAQRTWLWGGALACVNPFAVLFERKIWAQSILPLFCVLLIAGWWRRDTRWGSFAWGLAGAWVGQLHMSGFFFAAALLAWTLLTGRRDEPVRERMMVRWSAWVAGSVLGALTLIPWIYHVLAQGSGARQYDLLSVVVGNNFYGLWFWILWLTGALGLGMSYSLGIASFERFLRYPQVDGVPTHLVGFAHVVILSIGAWLLISRARQLAHGGVPLSHVILGSHDPVDRLIKAGLFGFGLLISLAGIPILRHYLIITFPLEWLWLSRQVQLVARRPNVVLAALWLCELFISASFLAYIHVNHGAPLGDYGVPYIHQR